MKTATKCPGVYAETEGEKPFDWNEFLNFAIKYDITESPSNIRAESGNWTTCACGNQCAIIPRDSDGRPLDRYLHEWGEDFHDKIDSASWVTARSILAKIEKRSAFLIKKIREKSRKGRKARK